MKEKLIILLMLSAFFGRAQSEYSLSFGYYDPVISDTAYMEGILGVSLSVVNNGSDTIFWAIQLVCSVNSEVSVLGDSALFPSGDGDYYLAPGDSFHLGWPEIDSASSSIIGGYVHVKSQNGFVDGDNIIVVWPVVYDNDTNEGGEIISIEQYTQGVYVIDDITGTKTHIKQPNFKVFLTSDSRLYVEGLGKQITALAMYDLLGKKIIDQFGNEVNTQHLAKGIYVLEVGFKDGEKQTTKVFIPN